MNIHRKISIEDAKDIPTRFTYHNNTVCGSFKLLSLVGRVLFGVKNPRLNDELVQLHAESLMKTDVLADEVARDVHLAGGDMPRLFKQVLHEGIGNKDVPESVKNYYLAVHTIPPWLDKQRLKRGIETSNRTGRIGMYGLSMLGLLAGYSNPDLSKPLIATGYLTGDSTFNRVNFTSAFWMEVTESVEALEPGGVGFQTAINVRIKHALARHQILSQPNWKLNDWGVPINASDSAITNVGFSTMLVLAAKLLGFRITNEEYEDVLHLWRYIGYLMGDDDRLLPKTAEEGIQALGFITAGNDNVADRDSIQLANDLLNSFKQVGRGPYLEFSGVFKNLFYRAYAQYLIPPTQHKGLKLPGSYGLFLVIALVQTPLIALLDNFRHYTKIFTPLCVKIGRRGQRIFMRNRFRIARTQYNNLSSNAHIIKE